MKTIKRFIFATWLLFVVILIYFGYLEAYPYTQTWKLTNEEKAHLSLKYNLDFNKCDSFAVEELFGAMPPQEPSIGIYIKIKKAYLSNNFNVIKDPDKKIYMDVKEKDDYTLIIIRDENFDDITLTNIIKRGKPSREACYEKFS